MDNKTECGDFRISLVGDSNICKNCGIHKSGHSFSKAVPKSTNSTNLADKRSLFEKKDQTQKTQNNQQTATKNVTKPNNTNDDENKKKVEIKAENAVITQEANKADSKKEKDEISNNAGQVDSKLSLADRKALFEGNKKESSGNNTLNKSQNSNDKEKNIINAVNNQEKVIADSKNEKIETNNNNNNNNSNAEKVDNKSSIADRKALFEGNKKESTSNVALNKSQNSNESQGKRNSIKEKGAIFEKKTNQEVPSTLISSNSKNTESVPNIELGNQGSIKERRSIFEKNGSQESNASIKESTPKNIESVPKATTSSQSIKDKASLFENRSNSGISSSVTNLRANNNNQDKQEPSAVSVKERSKILGGNSDLNKSKTLGSDQQTSKNQQTNEEQTGAGKGSIKDLAKKFEKPANATNENPVQNKAEKPIGKIKFDESNLKKKENEYLRKLTPKEEIEHLRTKCPIESNLEKEHPENIEESNEHEMNASVEKVHLRSVNSIKTKISDQIKFGAKPEAEKRAVSTNQNEIGTEEVDGNQNRPSESLEDTLEKAGFLTKNESFLNESIRESPNKEETAGKNSDETASVLLEREIQFRLKKKKRNTRTFSSDEDE